MRRWVPGPAKAAAAPAMASTMRPAVPALNLADVPARDLAFCAEFAVHGGLAASEHGFRAETELARMQQAGLLMLQRDPAPPFAVLRVGLSPAMRDLLSSGKPGQPERAPTPCPLAEPDRPEPPRSGQAQPDRALRRNGFEVARGMISAAVKAEFAALSGPSDGNHPAELERRVMTRISLLDTPFGT